MSRKDSDVGIGIEKQFSEKTDDGSKRASHIQDVQDNAGAITGRTAKIMGLISYYQLVAGIRRKHGHRENTRIITINITSYSRNVA